MAAEVIHHGPGLKELYGALNLLVIGAIIYFAGWKSIKAGLKSRSENVSKKLNETRLQLEAMKKQYAELKGGLDNVQQMRTQLLREAEENGRKLSENMVQNAKQMADKIISDARLLAENEVAMSMSRLKEQLVGEAFRTSEELARGAHAKELHEQLVKTYAQGKHHGD